MLAIIRQRLVQAVIVCLGLSLVVFMLLNVNVDIAAELLPPDASREQVDTFRKQMGLDKPLIVQYFRWLGGAVQGDFGTSWRHETPAFKLVMDRMPATIKLAVAAQAFSLLIAVPLGILAATLRNSIWDRMAMGIGLIGQAMPHFWLGLMLMLLLSIQLKLLPPTGSESWKHLIMPLITLSARPLARTARLVRSGMLEVLNEDFIRTARAKGLADRVVLMRHALRNAMLPIITVIGLELGSLLNGSVVVESVFAWPGVGRLIIDALQSSDIPLVQASVFVIAVIYIFVNLLVDLSYTFLDPRVRYS